MSRVAGYRTERELRSYRRKIRRQKEIRRNMILAFIAAAFLIIFAFSYHTLITSASTETSEVSYKYFTSIQVKSGDTLWSIAKEYGDDVHYDSRGEYINEVKMINNLKDDAIVSGQYLIIPYYSYEFYK